MERQTDEFALAAAQAAIRFLERYTDSGAEALSSYIERLFQALQNGHSFIRLKKGEASFLSTLKPVVGESASPLILAVGIRFGYRNKTFGGGRHVRPRRGRRAAKPRKMVSRRGKRRTARCGCSSIAAVFYGDYRRPRYG